MEFFKFNQNLNQFYINLSTSVTIPYFTPISHMIRWSVLSVQTSQTKSSKPTSMDSNWFWPSSLVCAKFSSPWSMGDSFSVFFLEVGYGYDVVVPFLHAAFMLRHDSVTLFIAHPLEQRNRI